MTGDDEHSEHATAAADARSGQEGDRTRESGEVAIGYAAAMAELDAILIELDDDEVDVDALAAKVARAAELLRWCRSRITEARMQVQHVVAELEADEAPPT